MTLTLSASQARLLRLQAQRLLPAGPGSPSSPARVLQDVTGVQAQDLPAALLSIRARSTGLTASALQQARQEERSIVWTWCMRGTLHLVAAEDARWLLPLLGPRFIATGRRRFRQLGWDKDRAAAGLQLLQAALARSDEGLTRPEIVRLLQENDLPAEGQAPFHLLYRAALEGILCHGAHREDEATYVLLAEWLGRPQPLPRQEAVTRLVLRYLQAYGPATPEDMARWSGLKLGDIRQAWERLDNQLLPAELEGEPAWLLRSHLPRLDEDLERLAAARPLVCLLPRYDTYLLGYAGRDLAVEPEHARRVHPGGGIIHPVLLVDGQARGTWKTKQRAVHLELVLQPFRDLPPSLLPHVEAEVADLGRFLEEEVVLTVEDPPTE